VRAEAQVQRTEVQRELREMEDQPEYEFQEMILLLQHEGMSEEDAQHVVEIMARYPIAYQKTMVEKELGLPFDPGTVKIPEALTMGISYIIGSIFPLIAYFFFPVRTALPISVVLTLVALVVVGIIKGNLANLNLGISILEVVVVGGLSALGGFVLGNFIPHLFGF